MVLPTGLKTAEAAAARFFAYMAPTGNKDVVTSKVLITAILNTRDRADFAPGNGHRRGALIAAIASIVHVASIKGGRDVSPKMRAMIETQFPRAFIDQFLLAISGERDKELRWMKDGEERIIYVTDAVFRAPGLQDWAIAAWPAVRV